MTEIAERPKTEIQGSSRYSAAEITRALVEVAACSGNTHKAARQLAEDADATSIDQKTLWLWSRRTRKDEYERIRQEVLPAITAQASEQHMALARQQMELAQAAAGFVAARLEHMEDKDLVNAMGKADIGSGIHTEKAQLLAGQPTHRAERTVEELMRGLAGRGLFELGEKRQEADGSTVERVAVVRSDDSRSSAVGLPRSAHVSSPKRVSASPSGKDSSSPTD